jgi:hypothetical protein
MERGIHQFLLKIIVSGEDEEESNLSHKMDIKREPTRWGSSN